MSVSYNAVAREYIRFHKRVHFAISAKFHDARVAIDHARLLAANEWNTSVSRVAAHVRALVAARTENGQFIVQTRRCATVENRATLSPAVLRASLVQDGPVGERKRPQCQLTRTYIQDVPKMVSGGILSLAYLFRDN